LASTIMKLGTLILYVGIIPPPPFILLT
jgi:hypothetical protein